MTAPNVWGRRSSRSVAIGAAVAALVVCCVLPFACMVAQPLASTQARLTLDSRQLSLLFRTAMLGAGTALTATVVGAPLGFLLARAGLRSRTLLRVLLVMPVLLPPYVVGLAWLSLGGRTGLLTLMAGRDLLTGWIYSLFGTVLILSFVFYPLSMLATEAALRRIEPHLEEAALLVAGPRRVFRRITLPLAGPGIAAAALIIFVLAISEFGVPGLLGVRVYPTEIFTAFAAQYDSGRATVLALPLLLLSSAAAALAVVMTGDRLIVTRRATADVQPLTFAWGRRVLLVLATSVGAIALVLPLAALARESLGARWTASLEGSGVAVANSLMLATIGATLTVLIGASLGYARARGGPRSGALADLLFVVLFAVPATVVGVGLIGMWNRPGAAGAIYGTPIMLLLAYLGRFLPVAALTTAALVRQVPLSHEEAAAAAGATWLPTMRHIVLPQVATGLAALWVVVFVLAFGELGASILVAPPGESTLPIRIYTLIANTPASQVAALALFQAGVIVVPLLLLAGVLALREAR